MDGCHLLELELKRLDEKGCCKYEGVGNQTDLQGAKRETENWGVENTSYKRRKTYPAHAFS